MMTRLFRYILDIFYPNRCPCCMKVIKWDDLLCDGCIKKLEDISAELCPYCGKKQCICKNGLHYDRCISLCYYDGIVKDGIINLKLNNATNFAQYFAEKLCSHINEENLVDTIDFVTSVPMTDLKKARRGYNQAELFAKLTADILNKEYKGNVLIKTDKHLSQHTLSAHQRRESVKGAFAANDINIKNSTVLLCDDIITTGSTLDECAILLKKMGVKTVICVTMATTLLKL